MGRPILHDLPAMHMPSEPAPAPPQALPPGARRQLHAIRQLRERLFDLQCEPDPDPAAIDGLMRRLARVRRRCVAVAPA
jgi:hypothetical protein